MSEHVLPDSRLQDRSIGIVKLPWRLDGQLCLIDSVPIFCMSCGKMYGYVPEKFTVFVGWLCRGCHETYGDLAGTYAMPDDEFNRAVGEEIRARFGRDLTEAEIIAEKEKGNLGPLLEALERDSPYKSQVRSEAYHG